MIDIISNLTDDELIKDFSASALEHYRQMLAGNIDAANAATERGLSIRSEIERRGHESKQKVLPLLSHDSASVRSWAAGFVVSFAPNIAGPVLEELVNERGAIGMNAMMSLNRAGLRKDW